MHQFQNGMTPLVAVTSEGDNADVLSVLAAHGADLDIPDEVREHLPYTAITHLSTYIIYLYMYLVKCKVGVSVSESWGAVTHKPNSQNLYTSIAT